jgi:diacylglycerol kinase (ATP)
MTDVRRGGITAFVNPRSRANRRNPRLAAEFTAVLGDAGRVLAPASLDELRTMAAALREAPPDVIAVHGGDGTLHKVVTALGATWGDRPLPPIAVLTGGTMNVVATSLRIATKPVPLLRALAEMVRARRLPDLITRRCMRISVGTGGDLGGDGDHLGFVFGNGLSANFLGEYYATANYGPRRALWLLARTFFSALVDGPFVHRIFRRYEGEVRVDGAPLPRTRFVGVSAATVTEVGLGFKLNHRADDDPDRFGVLAIHSRPVALIADFPAVHAGRGIAPSRAFSAVASTLELAPPKASTKPSVTASAAAPQREMAYTIDGDLYTAPAATLRISLGPRIQFVRPPEATRPPTLLSVPVSDTMAAAR